MAKKLFYLFCLSMFCQIAFTVEVYRLCRTLYSFPACDFTDLDTAISQALPGSTIEICGPATYNGPSQTVGKLLNFVCATDCSTDPNPTPPPRPSPTPPKPKKKKKKTVFSNSKFTWNEEQQRLLENEFSKDSEEEDVEQQDEQTQDLDYKNEIMNINNLRRGVQRESNSDTGTSWDANRGSFGTTSQVMLTPIKAVSKNIGPQAAGIEGRFVVFEFNSSSTGSSVYNCEFLCQAQSFSEGIDIGIAGIGADKVTVQHNNFEACYIGVYVSEGSRWDISDNDFQVRSLQLPNDQNSSYAFSSTGVMLASNALPLVAPIKNTRFNAIHDNLFSVQGPFPTECSAASITPPAICGTGGAISLLDFDQGLTGANLTLERSISLNDIFRNTIRAVGDVRSILFGILLAHIGLEASPLLYCASSVHYNVIDSNTLDGIGILVLGADGNRFLDNKIENIQNGTGSFLNFSYFQPSSVQDIGADGFSFRSGIENCLIGNILNNPLAEADFLFENSNPPATRCAPTKNVLIANDAGSLSLGVSQRWILDNSVFSGNIFNSPSNYPCDILVQSVPCGNILLTPPPGFEMPCGVVVDNDNNPIIPTQRQRFDRTSSDDIL